LSKYGGYSCVDSYLGHLFCSTGLHICFCASSMLLLLLWLCSNCTVSLIAFIAQYCLRNPWSFVFPSEL
jgi:hypothetical protein